MATRLEIGIAIGAGIGIHSAVVTPPATSTKLYQTEANKETETKIETETETKTENQRLETAPTVAAPVIELHFGDGQITAGFGYKLLHFGVAGKSLGLKRVRQIVAEVLVV